MYNVFDLSRDLMLPRVERVLWLYMWKSVIPTLQIAKFNGHRPSDKDIPCGGKDINI